MANIIGLSYLYQKRSDSLTPQNSVCVCELDEQYSFISTLGSIFRFDRTSDFTIGLNDVPSAGNTLDISYDGNSIVLDGSDGVPCFSLNPEFFFSFVADENILSSDSALYYGKGVK